jgi:hypothetical protein
MVRKSPAKRSIRKKSPAKRKHYKSPAKKSARRKSPAKKSARRKSPAKKSVRRKSPAKKSVRRKSPAKKSTRKKVMRGGFADVNPTFKKLYKMLKNVPLIKIPVIPQFEQAGQKVQASQPVQKVQDGGYKKGFKLKTQENGTRKFVLAGFSYEKDINKNVPVTSEIKYELENKEEFGRFDNIKPQDAAKKIYSRLCKNLRKDYGVGAASCVNVLLLVQEQCCDNITVNNSPRDYYYYMQNTPKPMTITRKDGKQMKIYNNAKAIPIFGVRDRRNEIVRMQSVNEAVAVSDKKRNTSLAVYAKRKSAGKKLLKNARA